MEWAPSLPCLPLHPVTTSESLRVEGRESVLLMGMHSPLNARPLVPTGGGGWRAQKPSRSHLSWEGDSAGGSRKARCPWRVRVES